ncbi:hypothetical protein TNCV_802591 [Trichonephila clavipes]|nr:hypothetical protein TNCV_802591 [Trichonephila clavipes]
MSNEKSGASTAESVIQRRDQKSLENRGRRLGRPRDVCDLPIRRDEGRIVNTPLVFKRVLFGEKGEKETREREEPGLGWRKGKSPALDGERMRGEPWLERTGRERERKGFSPRLEWKGDERRWRSEKNID